MVSELCLYTYTRLTTITVKRADKWVKFQSTYFLGRNIKNIESQLSPRILNNSIQSAKRYIRNKKLRSFEHVSKTVSEK